MKQLYEFGRFTLDVEERRLLRDGQLVPLKPKVFETLLVLVENGAHVLAKEELMTRLWPDSFVEEANLAVNISQLRKALGDDENGEGFIETVPKRGYRFAAQVTRVLAEPVDLIVREHTKSRIVVREQETFAAEGSLAEGAERLSLTATSAVALPVRSPLGQGLVVAAKQHRC
jgi:DNA-binding winged helix-turn-helix (wHTH) protein